MVASVQLSRETRLRRREAAAAVAARDDTPIRGTKMRSTPEYVDFVRSCPRCGQDSLWHVDREGDKSKLAAPTCCGAAA